MRGRRLFVGGDRVLETRSVRKGTAIATFKEKGQRYRDSGPMKHACYFIRFSGTGFEVLEQHAAPDIHKIQARLISSRGLDYRDPRNTADCYYVVL